MKKRVDILVVDRGLATSVDEARALLMEGAIWNKEQRIEKPGILIDVDTPLSVRGRQTQFVSRAGEKLRHALDEFQIQVQGVICIDIGSSTGGFTDCLLQKGAKRVFSVDVGQGLLDIKLRRDPRVTVVEKQNARLLRGEDLRALSPEAGAIQLLVSDVSFISLRKIIPHLKSELPHIDKWVLLFKPQFELPKEKIRQGGIVEDQAAIESALKDFATWMLASGFVLKRGPETSPLTGKKSGNVEYLFYYVLS